MNLNITGHHVEVTPAIREYVSSKLDRVIRHFDNVTSVGVMSAAPPDNSDDWDGMLGVLVDVAEELEDHVEDGAFHNAVMSVTPTVAAYVSGLFTLAIEFKTDWNGHLGDTTVHEVADSTYTLSYTNPTTIAMLMTAAQEVYTDVPAHIAFAPKSMALRTAP